MASKEIKPEELVHIARLALTGRPQDVQLYISRLAKRYQSAFPNVASELNKLVQESPTRQSPLRRQAEAPIPVDLESRLQLLRVDTTPTLDVEPIWDGGVKRALEQLIFERRRDKELIEQGLSPTRSIIFTGPPGVGKTLAARWIARELHRPLLTLDLSAVMSSFSAAREQTCVMSLIMRKALTASSCWTSSTPLPNAVMTQLMWEN